VSAIVSNQQAPTVVPPTQGSLYQHLTNNQTGNQRSSPLIQQGIGRASPITPTPSPLVNDGHPGNNHTSVLQNMNSGTGGVISSAGFHGSNNDTNVLKVAYEKQTPSRIQAIQQEETTRRSR
jgi:hypothetical protein